MAGGTLMWAIGGLLSARCRSGDWYQQMRNGSHPNSSSSTATACCRQRGRISSCPDRCFACLAESGIGRCRREQIRDPLSSASASYTMCSESRQPPRRPLPPYFADTLCLPRGRRLPVAELVPPMAGVEGGASMPCRSAPLRRVEQRAPERLLPPFAVSCGPACNRVRNRTFSSLTQVARGNPGTRYLSCAPPPRCIRPARADVNRGQRSGRAGRVAGGACWWIGPSSGGGHCRPRPCGASARRRPAASCSRISGLD